MSDTINQTPSSPSAPTLGAILWTNELAFFGFLLNLCGVLAILIGCGMTMYQCLWLKQAFDIVNFSDGIGRLIQDDLIATGVLAGGMGIKTYASRNT